MSWDERNHWNTPHELSGEEEPTEYGYEFDLGWNTYPEPEEPLHGERGRMTSLLIGAAAGVLTLLVITALVFTTVAYLFTPSRPATTQPVIFRRQVAPPSEEDLRQANYRPSGWTAPLPQLAATPTPFPPELVAQADVESQLLENIYQRVDPSVVNIEIVSRMHSASDIIDSSGSGFVLDAEGHIVTNAHVVRDAEEILVTFYDGAVANAELVGYDDYSDLAVIRVPRDKATLLPVTLGDSNELHVGQRVIAIGNPFGLQGSMTEGIISALGRSLPSAQMLDARYQRYSNPSIIQVDASVNPGNSGGPLLDTYGRVIGINTAIRSDTGVFQGIAFAVPVNTMKRIVPQLIEKGQAEYPWLGISSLSTEGGHSVAALADELGLPVHYGVMVTGVAEDSPASHAGLRAGTDFVQIRGMQIARDADIIVAINGETVRDIDDLVAYLVENTSPGDTVVLTIVRDGKTLDVDVTLGVRP